MGASPGGEALGPTDLCHTYGGDRGHSSGLSEVGHWGAEDLDPFIPKSGPACSVL